MAAKKVYYFTVTGTYVFPTDMLRYDACWPSSGRDAAALADTFSQKGAWSINVTRANTAPFTNGRWESFGVAVSPN